MQTGYPNALLQVLDQLIDNAMRHGLVSSQQPQLLFKLSETQEDIQLCVCDNGLGIAEDNLPRIFEPFFSTKEVGEGTGLGLSVVYGILQRWGGHIDVASAPGKGSGFTLLIPLEDQSVQGLLPDIATAALKNRVPRP